MLPIRIPFIILVFLTATGGALACDRDCQIFNALKGRWWVGDFELIDSGHCMAEESLDLHLDFRELKGRRIVGEYTERVARVATYRECTGLGGYQLTYKFSIDLKRGGLGPDRKLFAVLDLQDCRQDRKRKCAFADKRMVKEIVPPKGGRGLLYDGIAFERAD